jgi:hypothetical protein
LFFHKIMLLTIGDGKSEKMLHLLEIQKSKFKSQNCNLKLKTGFPLSRE